MPVADADLKFYLAASRPVADTGTSGGALDPKMQLIDRTYADAMNTGSGEQVKLTSDSAADTQNCTLMGYAPDGTWATETFALTGVTPKVSTNTYLHLVSLVLASDANGTIAVTGNTTAAAIHTIPIGERGAARMFILAKANAVGGASKDLYEKVFVGNDHASDAAIEAKVWLAQDAGAYLTMDCEMSGDVTLTGGSETTANRVTEPTTGGTYSWGEHASEGAAHVAGDAEDGNLAADEWQGVWIKLTLAAGLTPDQDTQWQPAISAVAT